MSNQPQALMPILGMTLILSGCASPFDAPPDGASSELNLRIDDVERSIARQWHSEVRSGKGPTTRPSGSSVATSAEKDLDENSTLNDYLVHAALNNPGLESAFARWKAALLRLPQVRSLPDPKFTYGVFINEVETRVGPQQHRVAVAQMFPWFGKLKLKEGIAAQQAEVAYAKYRSEILRVFHEVNDVYYQRAGLDQDIRITGENIKLIEQLEIIARARLRGGASNHPDVIKLQIAMEKLQDQLRTLQDRRKPLNAGLNASMNRQTDAPLSEAFRLPDELLDASDKEVIAACLANNPNLQALKSQIEGGRLATRLARKSEMPDVTLGLDYIATGEAANPGLSESGDDPIVASISINLPIWREKYEAEVAEAIAKRYSIARQRQNLQNTLTASIQDALYEYRTAQRQVVLYRDTLLPKAEQALQATLSAYQTGESSFLDLLDAQRELLELELMHIHARTARARQLARLDLLTGVELPRKTDQRSNHEVREP